MEFDKFRSTGLGASALTPECSEVQDGLRERRALLRLLAVLAVMTFGLIALGGLTRTMGAGLSCPDWPLCYGQILPHWDPYIFLEWFHRLIATLLGFGTIGLLALSWRWRAVLPRWVPAFAVGALALVVFQGILGKLTVTESLHYLIVTGHLGMGTLFFGTLIAALAALSPPPANARPIVGRVGALAALVLYGQILLGGLVSTQWALNQCLAGSVLCHVLNSHLFGVVPASLAVIATAVLAWRGGLKNIGLTLGGLLAAQIALGVTTYYLKLSVVSLTVAHLVVGVALFGVLVWLAVNATPRPSVGRSTL